jgi:hypothetical protein
MSIQMHFVGGRSPFGKQRRGQRYDVQMLGMWADSADVPGTTHDTSPVNGTSLCIRVVRSSAESGLAVRSPDFSHHGVSLYLRGYAR